MKTIRLTKLAENSGSLKSKHIQVGEYREGAMDHEPTVGEPFVMPFVTSKNGTNCTLGNYFITSHVIEILERNSFNGVTQFRTENSIYRIEVLKETFNIKDIVK